MRFRRRTLAPGLASARDAFETVLEEIEPAKAGLSDVLPGTRLPGRPLGDALGEFRERLGRAALAMPDWRRPELEQVWRACDEGLRGAIARATRVAADPPEVAGFEQLLWLVESLLDPLEPFADAEDRFRRLRS